MIGCDKNGYPTGHCLLKGYTLTRLNYYGFCCCETIGISTFNQVPGNIRNLLKRDRRGCLWNRDYQGVQGTKWGKLIWQQVQNNRNR